MTPIGALKILFEEANTEETRFSDKQKNLAYHTLKDLIGIMEIVKEFLTGKPINDGEREVLQEWLTKK